MKLLTEGRRRGNIDEQGRERMNKGRGGGQRSRRGGRIKNNKKQEGGRGNLV